MVHRTHLTTPPGETPVTENEQASELYTPGLAVPVEPTVPMRFRGQLITLVTLLVLGGLGWLAFEVITSGQDFDPALDVDTPVEDEFDPTIPLPDGGEG